MEKLIELENRIAVLEEKAWGGRPPVRLEAAKAFLKKELKKPQLITDVVAKSEFNHALLSRARKELGYEVYNNSGKWYWRKK